MNLLGKYTVIRVKVEIVGNKREIPEWKVGNGVDIRIKQEIAVFSKFKVRVTRIDTEESRLRINGDVLTGLKNGVKPALCASFISPPIVCDLSFNKNRESEYLEYKNSEKDPNSARNKRVLMSGCDMFPCGFFIIIGLAFGGVFCFGIFGFWRVCTFRSRVFARYRQMPQPDFQPELGQVVVTSPRYRPSPVRFTSDMLEFGQSICPVCQVK